MAKQKIEIEVDVPDGWQVARFGPPRDGEYFFSDGQAIKASMNFTTEKLILRRVKSERIDRIKQTIIELEGLTMCAEDLMHRTKKQFAEFELNGFDYLMASAVIDVDDACEELKKMVAEMEASND